MSTVAAPLTLVDLLPRTKTRTVASVVGFALFTALAAQVSFHLPWTPVPITGQTFAVLLTGASLGAGMGAASQLLYVAMGAAGLPFYAHGTHGWSAATGSTGGYLVGFVLAAALVGRLAEQRQDRSLITCLPAMLAGNAVIYLTGVPWLAHVIHVDGTKALELGFTPFVIGDLVKLAAAGVILPSAWRLTRR